MFDNVNKDDGLLWDVLVCNWAATGDPGDLCGPGCPGGRDGLCGPDGPGG